MDLIQIKYFLALSKTLNFTRAAEACNVSQPALTKSIQRLEDEMGGALILRERNQTQLTELGRRLLPALQQTYDAAANARHLAVEFRKQDRAPLRLGLGPDVEAAILLPLIRELGQRLPGFEITVQTGATADISDWLLHAQVDVAVIAEADTLPERANRWPLFSDPVVAMVPAHHPLDQDGPVEYPELARHLRVGPILPDTPLGRLRAHIMAGDTDAAQNGSAHRGSNERIISALVTAGLGVGLATLRHDLPPGVVRRPVSPAVCLTVSVAVMAGRPIARAAEIFVKLARARAWTD